MSSSDCRYGFEYCAGSSENLGDVLVLCDEEHEIAFDRMQKGSQFSSLLIEGEVAFYNVDDGSWWFCPDCHRDLRLRLLGRQELIIEEAFA